MGNQGIHYPSVLKDMKIRLEALDVERSELTSAIRSVERIIAGPYGAPGPYGESQDSPENRAEPSKGIYEDMTMREAAIHFLRTQGKRQKTKAIVDGLEAGGIKAKATYRAVYNILTQEAGRDDGRVLKTRKKEWELREWTAAKLFPSGPSQP